MRFVLPWRREREISLPDIWKAIAVLPIDGHEIQPAKVGVVKPLKAKREHEFMKLLERKRA